MLDRWAQKHDVKGHNESQRNISEVNTYRAWDFFDHSNAEANLLIDGGCADDRAALIASFVKNTTENSSEPVIILSQNQKTKQLLIEMAQADKIGELFVLDSNNNEYDFFSGMKKNNIINFFKNMASSRGYTNINSLDSYITAFIDILSVKTTDINLSSLLAFSENTDTQIIDFAIKNGRKTAANALQSEANSRADFRTLLIQLRNAVEPLTLEKIESKLSVSTIIHDAYVFYIDISDITDDVIAALYFTEEINSVWFGGEPLMAAGTITRINNRLISAGIKVESTVTTNGILINQQMIENFKKWNVTRVQITIDGIGDEYNKVKNYTLTIDLSRFVEAHKQSYETALNEIKNGHKYSHWMWYIFPQIQGLGRSSTSRYYAIKNSDEALAFLNYSNFPHRNTRKSR